MARYTVLTTGRVRNINDLGMYRTIVPNAVRLIQDYRIARKHGCTQRQSLGFAVYNAEAGWHSGRYSHKHSPEYISKHTKGHKGRKPDWLKSPDIQRLDTSPERVLALLTNTGKCKSPYTMQDLDDTSVTPEDLVYSKLQGTAYLTTTKRAARNYHRIVGDYHTCGDLEGLTRFMVFDPNLKRAWLPYKRGRDLFVLWKFNIPRAVEAVLTLRPGLPVYPHKVVQDAYAGCILFRNVMPDRRSESYTVVLYIRRYANWFRQPGNIGRVDELPYHIPQNLMHLPPLELMRRRREIERQRNHQVSKQVVIDPTTLYPYAGSLPTVSACGLELRPVETYGELDKCAQDLHNCARNYHGALRNEAAIMIATVDPNRDGKVVALGKWEIADCSWSQVYRECNKPVNVDLRRAYESYGKHIPATVK